jgi:RNA polymerase sigma-70 factor (ECF subfamily)
MDNVAHCEIDRLAGVITEERKQALDGFLAQIERRAYQMALFAVTEREAALDLVQEAMLRLVRRYADRPEAQWRPLFYRILHNLINDYHRRGKWRNLFHSWFGGEDEEMSGLEAERQPDDPMQLFANEQAMTQLEAALTALPLRQRQAFLLRTWEGLDVSDTAQAMGCSEGSVKTHTARAMQSLRQALGEHWS